MSTIYFIIFILFVFYILWTWKSTVEMEKPIIRISYIAIGTIFISFLTLILFLISKIGINYPKQEMIGQVEKIVLLIFIPINGFIVLTQVSSIIASIKSGMISKEERRKRVKILTIIFIILIILECIYFKNIQLGLINFINAKK